MRLFSEAMLSSAGGIERRPDLAKQASATRRMNADKDVRFFIFRKREESANTECEKVDG